MHRRIQSLGYIVFAAVMSISFACNSSEPTSSPGSGNDNVQPEPGQRTLAVTPESGPPGMEVHLVGSGYAPNSTVQIGVGPVQSEYSIVDQTQTDAQGQLHLTATVPTWTPGNQRIVFVATTEDASWKVISNEFDVTGAPSNGNTDGVVTVTGTLTTEGIECQAMRGEDGKIYTLLGDLVGFSAGTRVRITGTPAEISFCMQGTTINVSSIERL
jgi:hypothetical protein